MRCRSTWAGESCSLEHGHGSIHMTLGGKHVWTELQLEDYDGFEIPLPSEDDLHGPITNAVEYTTPYPHVVITRKPITRLQQNCRKCRGSGVVYDPFTAERGPCPSCQPASK